MRFLIAAVLLCLSGAAFAHDFELTFTEPTAREDGAPFDAATEADFYIAQCAADQAFTAPLETIFTRAETLPDGAQRYFLWQDAVQTGGWYFCRLNVTDSGGLTSDWSNVESIRKQAKPRPPVLGKG